MYIAKMAEYADAMRGKGQCCQCNGRGTCRNCICAKASRPCKNCTPGRSMKCWNPYAEECQPGETTGMITNSQAERLQASLDETLGGTQEPVMNSMHIGTRPTDLANTGPAFMPLSSTQFRWGKMEDHVVSEAIARAYEEQTI